MPSRRHPSHFESIKHPAATQQHPVAFHQAGQIFFNDSSPCKSPTAMGMVRLLMIMTRDDMRTYWENKHVSENEVLPMVLAQSRPFLNGKICTHIIAHLGEFKVFSRLVGAVHKIPCLLLQRRPVHKILEPNPSKGLMDPSLCDGV